MTSTVNMWRINTHTRKLGAWRKASKDHSELGARAEDTNTYTRALNRQSKPPHARATLT